MPTELDRERPVLPVSRDVPPWRLVSVDNLVFNATIQGVLASCLASL